MKPNRQFVSSICMIFIISAFDNFSHAQVTFLKYYPDTNATSQCYSMVQAANKGYALFGVRFDTVSQISSPQLIITDSLGNCVLTRGFGNETLNEQGWSISNTPDNGYIMMSNSSQNFHLIKTTSSGKVQWIKKYANNTDYPAFGAVKPTTDGGYIVVSSRYSSVGHDEIVLFKLNANGDSSWAYIYGVNIRNRGNDVVQTKDGGYFIGGSTYTSTMNYNMYLLKTDHNGLPQWSGNYGSTGSDRATCVSQTADGGYIGFGNIYNSSTSMSDAFLVKLNSAGDTMWTKSYTTPGKDRFGSYIARQTADGGYVTFGDYQTTNQDRIGLISKLDQSGNVTWTRTFGSGKSPIAYGAVITSDGGFAVSGEADVSGFQQFYLLKTDATGTGIKNNLVFYNESLYPNPASGNVNFIFNAETNGKLKISIYNLEGKNVLVMPEITFRQGNNTMQLPSESLCKGIYFVKFESGMWTSTQKLILE